MKLYYGLLFITALSATGCTEVMPRQRGALALPQMAITPDPLEFGFRQHTAFSKEAAAGGYGGGGGWLWLQLIAVPS